MAENLAVWYGRCLNGLAPELDQSRVGGRPWGFPPEEWPTKADGEPLVFIAQFRLPSLLDKPELVYIFSAQTYDSETSECLNETWEPSSGTTAVRLFAEYGTSPTDGPHLNRRTEFEWHEGYCWDFPSGDHTTEEEDELIEEEFAQPNHSETKIGGAVRWWQGGPVDQPDRATEYLFSVLGRGIDQVSDYILGIAHIFRYEDDPSRGFLIWEMD
jgi:hypothetical protein